MEVQRAGRCHGENVNLPEQAGSQGRHTDLIFHTKHRIRRWPSFLGGAIVGALAVALAIVWAPPSLSGGPGDGPSSKAAATTPSSPPEEAMQGAPHRHDGVNQDGTGSADLAPEADASASRLQRCQEVFAAQTRLTRAAAPSLSQWQVHIGAMNQLVVGAIDLNQASQFWDQTRRGAMARLDAYAAAQRTFQRRTARCPWVDLRGAPSELRTCTEAVAARVKQLRAAAVTLQTWRVHVHHMEMLRAGEMTPEHATRLWLKNWRKGDLELVDYRTAERRAHAVSC